MSQRLNCRLTGISSARAQSKPAELAVLKAYTASCTGKKINSGVLLHVELWVTFIFFLFVYFKLP